MVLGIDLGTTYSVGAFMNSNGEPDVIVNSEGGRITPSVVYFENKDSILVGQVAKDNCILYPKDVVAAVKNYMGQKKEFESSFGEKYTPELISSMILRKVVNDANTYLNVDGGIHDVVVTIPAYFTDSQRKATEDAARIAGLNLITTMNEPTAAAIYYAYKTKMDHGNIMVYDLGGGTFDVTIIRLDGDNVTVLSTGGLSKVGGRFFDQNIVDYICDYMEEKYEIDLQDEDYVEEFQELFIKAENCKKQLSTRDSAEIALKVGKYREKITITREFLEQKVSKLYQRTEFVVKKAMRDAGLEFSQLNKVVLVGGSSRIPYVEKHLEELTGQKPSKEVNPDEVVAMGAALYAKHITEDKAKGSKMITDVCSHSIGIVTVDTATNTKVNTIQIPRNTQLPAKVEKSFLTIMDNQRAIELSITEGEFRELTDVNIISTSMIDLPANLPRRTKIIITIALDQGQLVHIYLKIPSVDMEREFTIQREANLNEEELIRYTGIMEDCSVN